MQTVSGPVEWSLVVRSLAVQRLLVALVATTAESVRGIGSLGAEAVPREGGEPGPCQPVHGRRPAGTVAILPTGPFPSLD